MTKKLLTIGGVIIAMAVTATVQAVPVPITGSISMSGSASFDTASVNTATTVTAWGNPNAVTVGSDNGAFGAILSGSVVTMTPNWTFAPAPGSQVSPLWSVGGFTFSIISDTIIQQSGGFLTVSGIGTMANANYLTTTYAWNFSSQDPLNGQPAGTGTFSAAALGVPDGGTTAMLLGIALSGVALLRKKLTA